MIWFLCRTITSYSSPWRNWWYILGFARTRLNGPFSEIQHPKKRAFLVAYAETRKKGLAAELAGIDRSAIYQPGWRDDFEFKEALERASAMAADMPLCPRALR